jgi:hypothetical protein
MFSNATILICKQYVASLFGNLYRVVFKNLTPPLTAPLSLLRRGAGGEVEVMNAKRVLLFMAL